MPTELVLDSLQRRMGALHSVYTDALDTMGPEQVNHFEREGVLPIAFSLFHIANMIDASFLVMTGTPPIWDDGWVARVRPAIADHGKHRTVAEMVHQRIGDYEAFKEYLHAVFDRTEEWLAALDPSELTRVVVSRPFPEQVASTFSAAGGRSRGRHPPRRRRVLDLPARAAPPGRDRARPRAGRPGRDDVLRGSSGGCPQPKAALRVLPARRTGSMSWASSMLKMRPSSPASR